MLLSTAEESSRVCWSKPHSALYQGEGESHAARKDDRTTKEDGSEQMDQVSDGGGQGEGCIAQSSVKKEKDKSSASLQRSSWRSISLSEPKTSTEGHVKDTQAETSEPPVEKGTENSSSKQDTAPENEPAGDSSIPPSNAEPTPKTPQDREEEGKKGIRKKAQKEEDEEVTWAISEVALPILDPPEKIKGHKQAGLSSSSERSLQPPSSETPFSSRSASQLSKANVTNVLLKDAGRESAPEQSGEEQGKKVLDFKAKTPGVLASSSESGLKPSAGVTLPPLASQSLSAVGQGGGQDALLTREKSSGTSKAKKGRRSSADRSTAGQKGRPKGGGVAAQSEQNLTTATSDCKTRPLSAQSMSGIDGVRFEGCHALRGGEKARGKEREGLSPEEKHEAEAATKATESPPPDQPQSKDELPVSSGLSSASVKLLPLVKQASPLSSRSESRMGEGSNVPFIAVQTEDGATAAPRKAGDHPPNKDTAGAKAEVGHGSVLALHNQEDKGITHLHPPQDPTGERSPSVTLSSALSPTSSSDSLPTVTDNSGLLTESQRTEDSGMGERSSSQVESSLPFGIVYHPPALTPPKGVKVGGKGRGGRRGVRGRG